MIGASKRLFCQCTGWSSQQYTPHLLSPAAWATELHCGTQRKPLSSPRGTSLSTFELQHLSACPVVQIAPKRPFLHHQTRPDWQVSCGTNLPVSTRSQTKGYQCTAQQREIQQYFILQQTTLLCISLQCFAVICLNTSSLPRCLCRIHNVIVEVCVSQKLCHQLHWVLVLEHDVLIITNFSYAFIVHLEDVWAFPELKKSPL